VTTTRHEISGRTTVVGLIGDPVDHSLSPAIHNAAFAHLGLDWVYVAFPVHNGATLAAPGSNSSVRAAIEGAVALGLRGLSVTMPHKQAAAAAVSERTASVEILAAANTIDIREGVAVGCSTDGAGLLADLEQGARFDVSGHHCVVLGAGGAARAAALALAQAGASSVVVVNRTPSRAEACAALAGSIGRVGGDDDIRGADLVVNATPVSNPETPRLARSLSPGQLAVDLVYAPEVTPFLHAATQAGAATRNGLGMLVHQAALQLELWSGEIAPLDVMWDAARRSSAHGGR